MRAGIGCALRRGPPHLARLVRGSVDLVVAGLGPEQGLPPSEVPIRPVLVSACQCTQRGAGAPSARQAGCSLGARCPRGAPATLEHPRRSEAAWDNCATERADGALGPGAKDLVVNRSSVRFRQALTSKPSRSSLFGWGFCVPGPRGRWSARCPRLPAAAHTWGRTGGRRGPWSSRGGVPQHPLHHLRVRTGSEPQEEHDSMMGRTHKAAIRAGLWPTHAESTGHDGHVEGRASGRRLPPAGLGSWAGGTRARAVGRHLVVQARDE